MMAELRPQAIVHTAAQPSHDRAAAFPFDDFDTNAVGTLNLLEATRQSWRYFPLSRQAPQPERTAQPPPANEAPHATSPSQAAAPTPSRG